MKVITHPSNRTYKAECPYCRAVLECQWNDFKNEKKGQYMTAPFYATHCPVCKGTVAFTNCEVINPQLT